MNDNFGLFDGYENFDYYAVTGLRKEAQEKLTNIRPHSIGQATVVSAKSKGFYHSKKL